MRGGFDDDDGSLDPGGSGLWDYQIHPLTVRQLRDLLAHVDDELVVEVERYDGSGTRKSLRPMSIAIRGHEHVAEAVVFTVH